MVDYYGAQACCGTYAFINAAQSYETDVDLFEAMTSVPFGLKHIEGDFKRILTAFANCNEYLDGVAEFMGFCTETRRCDAAQDVSEVIRNDAECGDRFMIGPVDMGHLTHIPQSFYYTGQDHYFTVEVQSKDCLLVIDSEGTLFYPYTYDALDRVLSVGGIPESCGNFTIRRFSGGDQPRSQEEILCLILKRAACNMALARKTDQGARTFYRCWDVMNHSASIKWRLPLIHDASFLIQRKFMLRRLLPLWSADWIRPEIDRQIGILVSVRQKLLVQEMVDHICFANLADIENNISDAVIELEAQLL